MQVLIRQWHPTLGQAVSALEAIVNHPSPQANNQIVQHVDCFQILPRPTLENPGIVVVIAFVAVEPEKPPVPEQVRA